MTVGCSNGTTDDKTPQGNERTTVFTDKTQNVEITISNRDISARARDAVWNGDNYVLKYNGNAISSGTVRYDGANNQYLRFYPADGGDSFLGNLTGGVLTINELVQGGVTLKGLVLNQAGGSGVNGPATPTGPKQPTPVQDITATGINYDLFQVGGTSDSVDTTAIRIRFRNNINGLGFSFGDIQLYDAEGVVAVKTGTNFSAIAAPSWTFTVDVKKQAPLYLKINREGINGEWHRVDVFKVKQSIDFTVDPVIIVEMTAGAGSPSANIAFTASGLIGNTSAVVSFRISDKNVLDFASGSTADVSTGVIGVNSVANGTVTLYASGFGLNGDTVEAECQVVVVLGASALTGVELAFNREDYWRGYTYYSPTDVKTVVWDDPDAYLTLTANELPPEGVRLPFLSSYFTIYSNGDPFALAQSLNVDFVPVAALGGAANTVTLPITVTQDSPQSLRVERVDVVETYYQGFSVLSNPATDYDYTNLELWATWRNNRAFGDDGAIEKMTIAADGTLTGEGIWADPTMTTPPANADYVAANAKVATWSYGGDRPGTTVRTASWDWAPFVYPVSTVTLIVDRQNVAASVWADGESDSDIEAKLNDSSPTASDFDGITVRANYSNGQYATINGALITAAGTEPVLAGWGTDIVFTVGGTMTGTGPTAFAEGDQATLQVELYGKTSNVEENIEIGS